MIRFQIKSPIVQCAKSVSRDLSTYHIIRVGFEIGLLSAYAPVQAIASVIYGRRLGVATRSANIEKLRINND